VPFERGRRRDRRLSSGRVTGLLIRVGCPLLAFTGSLFDLANVVPMWTLRHPRLDLLGYRVAGVEEFKGVSENALPISLVGAVYANAMFSKKVNIVSSRLETVFATRMLAIMYYAHAHP
jgi:hypothetical protein